MVILKFLELDRDTVEQIKNKMRDRILPKFSWKVERNRLQKVLN